MSRSTKSARPDTWMPLYIGDYLVDTTHLTTEQHGAYMLLLMTCWKRGGHLPIDDAQLAQIARLTPAKWKAMKVTILAFFLIADTSISHKRINEELKRAAEFIEGQRLKGKEGGRPRKKPDGTQTKPEPFFPASESGGIQNPGKTTSPSPSPESPTGDSAAPPPDVVKLANEVIAAFDEARSKHFGAEQCRPHPTTTDAVIARRWIEGGVGVDLARGVFDAQFARLRAKGRRPADALGFFKNDIADALAAAREPLPDGRSLARPSQNGFERQEPGRGEIHAENWPQRLKALKDRGTWIGTWGPRPGEPGCYVPTEILKAHGYAG